MHTTVQLSERSMRLELTPAAERALRERAHALEARLELLFSCFVAKRMHFVEIDGAGEEVLPNLRLQFRAVVTSTCESSDAEGGLRFDDTVLDDPRPYVPKWCRIDYRDGEWCGEFGYDAPLSTLTAHGRT